MNRVLSEMGEPGKWGGDHLHRKKGLRCLRDWFQGSSGWAWLCFKWPVIGFLNFRIASVVERGVYEIIFGDSLLEQSSRTWRSGLKVFLFVGVLVRKI